MQYTLLHLVSVISTLLFSHLLLRLASDLFRTEFLIKLKLELSISRILTKSNWPPQRRSHFFRQLWSGIALEKYNMTFSAVIKGLREHLTYRPTCIKSK